MAKVLEFQLQHQSCQWIFRVDFLWDWLVWSPCSPRDSQESSPAQFENFSFSALNLLYGPTLTSVHNMTTGKTIAFTIWTFFSNVLSLLFNMLFRFVIAFLPRSKHLLMSWLQLPSTIILEPKRRKSVTTSTFPLSISHKVMEPDAMILVIWMFSFKPDFSLSYFTFIKSLLTSSLLSAIKVESSAYLRLLIYLLAILIPACNSSNQAFHIMYSVCIS